MTSQPMSQEYPHQPRHETERALNPAAEGTVLQMVKSGYTMEEIQKGYWAFLAGETQGVPERVQVLARQWQQASKQHRFPDNAFVAIVEALEGARLVLQRVAEDLGFTEKERDILFSILDQFREGECDVAVVDEGRDKEIGHRTFPISWRGGIERGLEQLTVPLLQIRKQLREAGILPKEHPSIVCSFSFLPREI